MNQEGLAFFEDLFVVLKNIVESVGAKPKVNLHQSKTLCSFLWYLLLTWFNFNNNMDKSSHAR